MNNDYDNNMLNELECKRCENKWTPRIDPKEVKQCPKCKSPYWNTPRINKRKKDV